MGLAALVGVLQKASQKRRNVKEDRSSDRLTVMEKPPLEKKATKTDLDAEMSRSNSQMSMATLAPVLGKVALIAVRA